MRGLKDRFRGFTCLWYMLLVPVFIPPVHISPKRLFHIVAPVLERFGTKPTVFVTLKLHQWLAKQICVVLSSFQV